GNDQGIIWANFFGRRTAFVNGPESLALRYKLPALYLHIDSSTDGNYSMRGISLYDGEEKLEAGVLTQRFADLLEANIRNNKTAWLWSHRRWKRTPGPTPE